MIDHLIDNKGNLIVQVGDEVENDAARFFVGAINDSQRLCAIDKDRPYALKDAAHPMAPCIRQGNYSASAMTLRRAGSASTSEAPRMARPARNDRAGSIPETESSAPLQP